MMMAASGVWSVTASVSGVWSALCDVRCVVIDDGCGIRVVSTL